jgi:hypothetical protein
MNTVPGTYQQQLLLALRLQNIPGPRIAEALAEVDSHVAETGEDPRQAFGEPKVYAGHLSEALEGKRESISALGLLRSTTWSDGALALAIVAGSGLLFQGLFLIGAQHSPRTPAVASAIAGVVLLVSLAVWMAKRIRRDADRVLDPRTGKNMAPPFRWWTIALWAVYPCGLLLLVYWIGATNR